MPNRMIRDSIKASGTVDALSAESERFFFRLILVADDFGRFEADPRLLLAHCFPLKVGLLRVEDVGAWYADLEKARLVQTYTVGVHRYGYFVTWDKYQRVRAAKSKWPDPPSPDSDSRTSDSTSPQPAATGGDSRTDAPESRETRVESRETRRNTLDQPRAQTARVDRVRSRSNGKYSTDFMAFWQVYPRRIGKAQSLKEWNRLNPDEALQVTILEALKWQLQSHDHLRCEKQFIPHPSRWLRGRRWEDPKPVRPIPKAFLDAEEQSSGDAER